MKRGKNVVNIHSLGQNAALFQYTGHFQKHLYRVKNDNFARIYACCSNRWWKIFLAPGAHSVSVRTETGELRFDI